MSTRVHSTGRRLAAVYAGMALAVSVAPSGWAATAGAGEDSHASATNATPAGKARAEGSHPAILDPRLATETDGPTGPRNLLRAAPSGLLDPRGATGSSARSALSGSSRSQDPAGATGSSPKSVSAESSGSLGATGSSGSSRGDGPSNR